MTARPKYRFRRTDTADASPGRSLSVTRSIGTAIDESAGQRRTAHRSAPFLRILTGDFPGLSDRFPAGLAATPEQLDLLVKTRALPAGHR